MTGWVGKESAGRRITRWLPLPVALALFALIGMAISTEDRNEFQARANQATARPDTSSADPTASTLASGGSPDDPVTTPTVVAATPDSSTPSATAPEPEGGSRGGAAVSFEITAPNGRLGIELGGLNPLARPVAADGTIGPPVELLDGPTGPTVGAGPGTGLEGTDTDALDATSAGADDGSTAGEPGETAGGDVIGATSSADQPVGLRLSDLGTLEPVGSADIAPGDVVVAPTAAGLDLLRPDGSRVEVRPGGSPDNPRVEAIEVAADGTTRSLEPDDSGRIEVGDGVAIRVPEPDDASGRSSSLVKRITSGPWRWVLVGVLALIGLAVVVELYRRRRPPAAAEPFGPGWVGPDGVPTHRFEEFLTLLAADPDPARAIRLAFSAAERGLGPLPRRQSTETPFEWYRRVAADHPELAEHLAGLCGCFVNARFAPTPPTAQERDLAVTELRALHRLSHSGPGRSDPTEALVEVGAGA